MDEQIVWICWIWFFLICMDRCILKLVDECICIDEQVFFVVYVDIWKFDEWMYVYVWIYGYDIYA